MSTPFASTSFNHIVSAVGNSNNAAAFGAAGQAMAELGVAGCIGMGCVQQGYLTPTMVSALSKTTFTILLPMFLCSSIIKTVTTYGLTKSSLAGPLLGVIQPFLLYLISRNLLLPLFGVDCNDDDGRCTAVCSAWGNTSVVPLIFVESLFRHRPDTDYLAQSYANISLFLVGWSPFFWSFGRSVLLPDENINGQVSTLQNIRRLFSPPVTGVTIGLIIAVSPLKHLFISNGASTAPPLAVLFHTIQNFGRAASPLSLLVLTSSLAIGIGIGKDTERNIVKNTTARTRRNWIRNWSCVSLARFVVSPLLVVGILRVFHQLGLIQSPEKDPMIWFISILQGCMPSAQNLVLMLQVAQKSQMAGEIAKFLFSIYATSMLPVVLTLTVALQQLGIF